MLRFKQTGQKIFLTNSKESKKEHDIKLSKLNNSMFKCTGIDFSNDNSDNECYRALINKFGMFKVIRVLFQNELKVIYQLTYQSQSKNENDKKRKVIADIYDEKLKNLGIESGITVFYELFKALYSNNELAFNFNNNRIRKGISEKHFELGKDFEDITHNLILNNYVFSDTTKDFEHYHGHYFYEIFVLKATFSQAIEEVNRSV
ncbi:conserved hypothetical protein [Vibrio aestuarianus]|nr:conserved hypothetical protein [Vibrio aestuarianus]